MSMKSNPLDPLRRKSLVRSRRFSLLPRGTDLQSRPGDDAGWTDDSDSLRSADGGEPPCCHIAESADGLHFEIQQEPCFTFENSAFQGYDGWPIDCRVTFFAEENCYYIIRPGNGADLGPAALLYRTEDFRTFEPIDIISLPSNRVPCLFPEKIGGKYVRLRPPLLPRRPHGESLREHLAFAIAGPDPLGRKPGGAPARLHPVGLVKNRDRLRRSERTKDGWKSTTACSTRSPGSATASERACSIWNSRKRFWA